MPEENLITKLRFGLVALLTVACALMGPAGCESGPPRKAKQVRVINRDVAPILRNTIGAEASMSGSEPIIVTGYGLVVGLNGAGSNDVPLPVRSYMVDEMTRMGVGKERGSLPGVTPEQLLDDPNTAVVVVQAVIPPGAPEGWTFDVRIDAVPGSSTKSLEGGMLWTTELRRGIVTPGGPATPAIATAYGPVFTNPFAKPGGEDVEAVDRRTGFVIGGGKVVAPWPLVLLLDSPSHARARAMTAAVNARFPRGSNPKPTARGVNEDTVEVNIPAKYREKPEVFAALLKHTRIDQQFPEDIAARYVETIKEQPELAEDLSWSLAALGELAIPYCRKLYDYPELVPRLAGLQAGARLGDATVLGPFQQIIDAGPSPTRTAMIGLLGELPADPKVNNYLRRLLDSADLSVRVAAYEALDKRNDGVIQRTLVAGKFQLYTVPSAEPTVYITQQKSARIVIFGEALSLNQPSFVSGWDGRLMIDAKGGKKVQVFYRDDKGRGTLTGEVDPSLTALIRYMAHKPTPDSPEPGLDFSYSQTVSALAELVRGGCVTAPIVPEQDKLALELLRAQATRMAEERPELSPDGPVEALPAPGSAQAGAGKADDASAPAPAVKPLSKPVLAGEPEPRLPDPEREKRKAKYVVPLNPAPKKN